VAESPEEKEALAKLDDEVEDVAWGELDKEAGREQRERGWFMTSRGLVWVRGPLASSDRRRLWRRRFSKKVRN
jgi:hypothetical protein